MEQNIHKNPKPDRITRCCLIGAGIVSGLELSLDNQQNICVSAGKAISSDGKYFELAANQIFTFYREFIPETDYPLFFDKVKALPLWELICDAEFNGSDLPLSPQYNQELLNPFLKDKVLLVYFDKMKSWKLPDEYDPDEYAFESAKNEENQKKNQKIHFILIQRTDLLSKLDISRLTWQTVWNRLDDDDDFIYSDNYNPNDDEPKMQDIDKAMNPALRLPIIPLMRFGFAPKNPDDCPPDGSDISYFPEIKNINGIYEGYIHAIDDAIGHLNHALHSVYHYYKGLMDKSPAIDIKDTLDILIDKWEAYKSKTKKTDSAKREYIQYFYDWMRDLLAAYHELREQLIDYTYLSFSGAAEFPNHFLLGQPFLDILTKIPAPLRQHFKQPPVYNGQADRLQGIKLYFWRILMMVKNFYLPGYIDEEKLNICNQPMKELDEAISFDELKVTPSKFFDQPLGEQAIPYYYYPVAQHKYSLHHFWDYKYTKNSGKEQILSYHASDSDDSYTNKTHIIKPLHYNLDKYPFYRIEGHIGKPLNGKKLGKLNQSTGTLENLKYIRKKYNLDFQIIYFQLFAEYPLTEVHSVANAENLFIPVFLGMEHLGGVQKGGTFILIADKNGYIIADFSLPYDCLHQIVTRDEKPEITITREEIEEIVGKAAEKDGDDLELLDGIGPETKEVLNIYGVFTFLQISKMTDKIYDALKIFHSRRSKWKNEALNFIKKTKENKK